MPKRGTVMIDRAERIVYHWHREADRFAMGGFPLLAMEALKECEVIEGLLEIIKKSIGFEKPVEFGGKS